MKHENVQIITSGFLRSTNRCIVAILDFEPCVLKYLDFGTFVTY